MNRIKWLDVCKGLGMLLVVLGHVMTTPVREAWSVGAYTYTLIYFFHMPLMFYISGVSYRIASKRYLESSKVSFTTKKAKSLIVPYILYNIAVYIVFTVANMVGALANILAPAGYGKMSIKDFVINMAKGDNPYSFHMWYIYAMFIMTMVLWIVERCAVKLVGQEKGHKIAAIILVIVGLVLVITRFYVDTARFGVINETMEFFIWFVIGRYIDTDSIMKKSGVLIFSAVSLIYMIVSIFAPNLLGKVSFYVIWPYVALVAKLGMILLIIKLAMIITDKAQNSKAYTFFAFTGFNSFYIYMFHQPFFGSGTGLVVMKVISVPVVAVVISLIMCYVAPIIIIKLKDKIIK